MNNNVDFELEELKYMQEKKPSENKVKLEKGGSEIWNDVAK
jgi:hypothetical protein